MKRLIRRIIFGVVALVLMINTNALTALAVGLSRSESALLYVTGYEVTNGTIVPGEEFTLTLVLENFSSTVSAEHVMVVIDNPVGIVPEYGTVTQAYIDLVEPGTTKEVSFRYTSATDISASEIYFSAHATSDSYSTTTRLIIPVGRMTDFGVESYTVPEKCVVNKTEYVSAMVRNTGRIGVSNVVMVARSDGKDIASADIGAMSAGTSKTQYVGVTFSEEGQHTFELLLTYEDEAGQQKEYVISSERILVAADVETEVSDSQTQPGEDVTTQTAENNSGVSNVIAICVISILLVVVCCVILLLIYRRKHNA